MVAVVSAGQLQEIAGPGIAMYPPWLGVNSDWLPTLGDVDPADVWQTQPAVRKVVDFIARNVASTPLKLYQRVSETDRRRVTDHPVDRILRMPSSGVTPYRFWHSIIVDWLLYDRWLAVKGATGLDERPFDLVRVQAKRATFADDGLGRVRSVRIDGGRKVLDDPAGWLLDHGYSPLGANGITPMATLQQVLREQVEAMQFRRATWRNGARTSSVIERPKDAPRWSPEARQRFIDGWREYTRDGSKAGGNPILEDGMTLAKVDAFSPRDTQDLDGRTLADVEVCSAFHIAPELLGARAANRSNMQAFIDQLWSQSLAPYYVALEQVLNVFLVAPLDDASQLYVEWDVDAKMRGSFEQQAAVLSTAVGAPWMTRSEARARVNLPELDTASGLVIPLNVLIGGQASPRDTGTQNENVTGLADLRAASATLASFIDRQRRVVKSRGEYDTDRWQRELADDLQPVLGEKAPGIAAVLNAVLSAELAHTDNPDAVLDRWQTQALEGAAC